MIPPSLNLDQYQIHRVGKEDVGFTSWAYMNDIVEQRYKLSGRLKD
jgi:hemolysin-activating ACP:hemolysin acyltransferase